MMRFIQLLVLYLAAASLMPAAGNTAGKPVRAGAEDRAVTVDLTNDGDYEVRSVHLELYSVWSRRTISAERIALNGPLKPGQTRTISLRLKAMNSDAGVYYIMQWYWDDLGNCSEGSRVPDKGTHFTSVTGKARCKSGKTPPEQMRADKLADAFAAGEQHFAEKRWEQAVQAYTDVLAIDPRHEDAIHHRAHAYQWLNQPDKAIADFSIAIAISPGKVKYYSDRGLTYVMKKDHEAAIADFNRGLELAPDAPDLIYRRSQVYCLLGKKDLAAADEKVLLDKGLKLPKTCQ